MAGGYIGKLLRVNLTSGLVGEEPLPEHLIRDYLGCQGIAARIIYDEVPSGIGALDSENRIVFVTGPFTGTGVQSPSNYCVATKDPITGYSMGAGHSHGKWGPNLKFAGFDGIIIQGAAETPVYLWIHDERCEVRDATRVWGRDAFDTEDAVREEIGERRAAVATIGPAGERLVAGAAVQNDKGHVAARGNSGMVMGAKKLKAVAVYGTRKVPVHDTHAFRDLAKKWREESFHTPTGETVNRWGTAGLVPSIHEIGDLPTKNFTTGVFPEYEKISGEYVRTRFKLQRNPCYGCTLAHCHLIRMTEGPYAGMIYEEPEYEDFSQLGSNLGIGDPASVMMLTDHVDRLGFDSNHAGAVISFGMEAYERGIVTKEDLDGLELTWGNVDAAKGFIRKVAYREGGIGETMALGLKKGAEVIGKGAERFAVHFKGEANHAHDSRATWGQFLGLVVSTAGPRWEAGGVDRRTDPELGFFTPQERHSPEGKALGARMTQMKKLYRDSLGICSFGATSLATETKAYLSLTGRELTKEEALTIGERMANVQRAFAIRHGFKPEHDLDVSPRLLEPPLDGGAKGKTIAPYLKDLVREYYTLMGWDPDTARPLPQTLERLGLKDIARDLWG